MDGQEHTTFPLRSVYDVSTSLRQDGTYLYLGGVETGTDDRFSRYVNFHGCISSELFILVLITTPKAYLAKISTRLLETFTFERLACGSNTDYHILLRLPSDVEIDYAGGKLRPLSMTLRRDMHIAKSSLPPSEGSCAAFGAGGAPSLLRGIGEDNTMIAVRSLRPSHLNNHSSFYSILNTFIHRHVDNSSVISDFVHDCHYRISFLADMKNS